MAARTRPGYALRTLLADEQARATAVEAIGAVAATKGTVPAADRTGAGPLARAGGPAGATSRDWRRYRPVLNVADNYGWPVVVRAESAVAWPHGTVPGVVAWLGSAAPDQPSGGWGVVAGTDFWDGAEPPPDAEIVLAAVPPDADLTPS